MRPNRLRELLDAGMPSVGTHAMVSWPGIVEVIGHAGGIDYVEFVAEYGPYDLYALENFGRAVDLFDHMTAMIKVEQEPRTFIAERAIGSGIQNVLFADVRSVEDAKECVTAVRADTPQTGGRHGSADRRFAGYVLEGGSPAYVGALEEVVIALMIEKDEAVKNLEAILDVGGIDMVQFGPSDYSMSIGKPGQGKSPEVQRVQDQVIETALRMGVQPRAEIDSPDEAKRYLDLGVRHFAIGTDLAILYGWWQDTAGELREIIGG
jgi:4-hydroxy-2-oxoheptanedioate aldolase